MRLTYFQFSSDRPRYRASRHCLAAGVVTLAVVCHAAARRAIDCGATAFEGQSK